MYEIRIDDNKIIIEMNNNEIIFSLILDLSFNKYIKRFKHNIFIKEFEISEEEDLKDIYNEIINSEYKINEKEKQLIINDEKEIKIEEVIKLTNEEMIKELIIEIKNLKKEKNELEKQVYELDNTVIYNVKGLYLVIECFPKFYKKSSLFNEFIYIIKIN